jgi:hypothetical protein
MQGEAGSGKLRRDRVDQVEGRSDIGHRRGRGRPRVARDVAGEPPDGVAQRPRLRQLALGRVRARAVDADGVEPVVHVSGRGEVIVDAVGIRPDRAHQAHGQRLIGQDPGALRARAG